MTLANSHEFDALLLSGGEHLRKGDVNEALVAFEAALVLQPNHPKALGLLGLVHFRRSDFELALPVYEKLVGVQSDDASAWLNLGLIHLKLGDAPKAIEELSRSRSLDPSQARTVSYLGLAYARNGDYALAFEAFLQAGQADLAQEMEQHLSDDERDFIVARVSAAKVAERAQSDSNARDSARPQPREVSGEIEVQSLEVPEPSRSEDSDPDIDELPTADDEPSPREKQSDAVSQMFELARERSSEPLTSADSGAISRAVQVVIPSSAAQTAATRTASGHRAPQSISQFATAGLVRPDDGDHVLEISGRGFLIIRVAGKVLARTQTVVVSSGDLHFSEQQRRVRGAGTGALLGGTENPLQRVIGTGYLVASPGQGEFSAVRLDHDILYLREDLVFAFQEDLSWENGHVPGSDHKIPVVQFRGQGAVAILTDVPLVTVKVAERPLHVAPGAIAGWIGRVIPRIVKPSPGATPGAGAFVECAGEGVVLLTDDSRKATE